MAKKMAVQLDTRGNRLRAGIMTYEEIYEHLCRLEYPSVDFGLVAEACKLTYQD